MLDQVDVPNINTQETRFFRRLDWSAFWTSCVLTFAVYFYTMCPTVGLEDSGELAVAGDYLGVPHPPGYPIWTIISWIFTKIFSFVKFRGQPNPAWGVTLVSVFFGALASGITSMLICRSGSDLLAESRADSHTTNRRTDNLIAWTGGVVASLMFSLSPVMWSQSVIVEVYSLNAFFLMLVFLLSYTWMRRPTPKLLYLTAFVFGLGLTNYQVLLLAALALMVIIMLRDIDLFRDMLIVGIVFVVTIAIIKTASIRPTPGFPKHAALADPALRYITRHTPLLLPLKTYINILLSLTFTVVSCIVARQTWKPQKWPVAPLCCVGIGIVILLGLLSNVPEATPIPPRPNQEVFTWGSYGLGFLIAMGALTLLCWSLPRGHMLAIAFISIEVTLAVLLYRGALLSLHHPTSYWFAFYVFLNFVFLGLAFAFLPNGRTVTLSILAVELGILFYVYMPIVSELRNPPMNWGYPRTWEGFKHAVTRGQYEKIAPANVFSARFFDQIGAYLTELREQFTLPVALLGFLPFTIWEVRLGKHRFKSLNIAIGLALTATSFIFIQKLLFPESTLLTTIYKFFILGIILLLSAGGLTLFVSQGRELVLKLPGNASTRKPERITTALVLLGILMVLFLYLTMMIFNIIEITSPLRESTPLVEGQFGSIVQRTLGTVTLMLAPLAAIALTSWLMGSRHKLRVIIDHSSQQWVIATLFGFLAMSIVLIALANPKGDIQDSFIQRVKFISSHGLYALWIGYGLIFGLAFVDTVFRKNPGIRALSIGTALLLPIIPLQQNAANPELIRKVGGAEQNGHDFGWQFGNYQLRGADAITEELEPDEEPLPNPLYPPEMTQDAIFFGGTDPGRFVPTYMIYSARVREDVSLITQNALADNTYMSVMRDLYGDQIWIPAQPDSARAFQRYVDEVKTGKRQKNAELKIEGGRVQVSGALGVMEINGILAQMIFEYNNYKHDFYVEESYVIPWMYPYLTPHGLIMKINQKTGKISPEIIRDDQDFWDWYTRRLTSDNRFLRDVVARKSFSKLRSAIAGLYSNRNHRPAAEEAYQQARILYPLSPEANFRLAQEVFMRQHRFDEAKDLMNILAIEDPGNRRIPSFLTQINNIESLTQRIQALEKRRKDGKMDLASALQLGDLYLQARQRGLTIQLCKQILSSKGIDPRSLLKVAELLQKAEAKNVMDQALQRVMKERPKNLPPEALLNIAQMYAKANMPKPMSGVMTEYLKLRPSDWKGWLDQSGLLLYLKKNEAAITALEKAIRLGGQQALAIIKKDPRFTSIRNQAIERSNARIGVPSAQKSTTIPGLLNNRRPVAPSAPRR
ncbi:MAG: DUF2723 domain-containing protein [Kiritimatiellae bacterium]|nr:DUF2723 domain-containing protein [Kiritimatiellia bacterium]